MPSLLVQFAKVSVLPISCLLHPMQVLQCNPGGKNILSLRPGALPGSAILAQPATLLGLSPSLLRVTWGVCSIRHDPWPVASSQVRPHCHHPAHWPPIGGPGLGSALSYYAWEHFLCRVHALCCGSLSHLQGPLDHHCQVRLWPQHPLSEGLK